jgi:hypothetical protein
MAANPMSWEEHAPPVHEDEGFYEPYAARENLSPLVVKV